MLSIINVTAQKTHLSIREKKWAFFHPVSALHINAINKKFKPVYELNYKKFTNPDFINGGRADAYRHVFFMALCAQKIKVSKLRKLGIAHEKGNYKDFLKRHDEDGERPDSIATVMDLQNNELGFILGSSNKKMSIEQLSDLVIKEINSGKGWIIQRKKNGTYIDCNGNTIDLKNYNNIWNVPKCLVPSNSVYID